MMMMKFTSVVSGDVVCAYCLYLGLYGSVYLMEYTCIFRIPLDYATFGFDVGAVAVWQET